MLSSADIRKRVETVVGNSSIGMDYNNLKFQALHKLMILNQSATVKKGKPIRTNQLLPLIELRRNALEQKQHTYEKLIKTLIYQRCIKSCINDKFRHTETPWAPRGFMFRNFRKLTLCKLDLYNIFIWILQ
ncbi:hypothetical protein AF332_27545 [Sporosarcina globispora]|uniref:Uncharacterized protein n=1 Tax=Sporosarcina globispora TaxID=1459 RepID=A0A0M0G133_SPOGL|nr:hypothetical protein AF332_27545 [Sporosarcina globispora]